MTTKDALNLLDLTGGFEPEEFRHNYHARYLELFQSIKRSIALDEQERIRTEILRINEAYSEISQKKIKTSSFLQFEFLDLEISEIADPIVFNDEDTKLRKVIKALRGNHQHGMAVSLLEIIIDQTVRAERGQHRIHYAPFIKMLGRTMLELGLIEQGIQLTTFGLNDYDKAKAYKKIGDFKLAAVHFGKSLKNQETQVPIDEICQEIALCYFLLGEYDNALSIVEDLLPELIPKKQIFEVMCKSKSFSSVLMISMLRTNIESKSIFANVKKRFNFPLSYKYVVNCFGTIKKANKFIEELEQDPVKYDEFFQSIKPEQFVLADVELEYSIEKLKSLYFEIFETPLQKSPIYHPK